MSTHPTQRPRPGFDQAVVERVRAALDPVEDPEIPVALADLGVIRDVLVDGDQVRLVLSPTRLGCPAMGEIARRLSVAAASVGGVVDVRVEWRSRAWSPEDVSERGRTVLKEAGYTLRSSQEPDEPCPYCGSRAVESLGVFGGSVCRQSRLCSACGSPYEALRSASCTAGALRELPGVARSSSPEWGE